MKKAIHSTADLARHLGISRWSVSRAINGQDGVSAEVAEQVRNAMKEFGFTPSPHGRGLRGQRTGVIGICFRALDTPVTIQKIAHVQRLVGQRGFRPLFELTGVDEHGGMDVINHFIAMRVEGVLLVDAPPSDECTPWLRTLRQNGIPTALLEPRGLARHNAVHLDREAALMQIADRLLALGHTHLGLLGISPRFPLGEPRYRGVERAVTARRLRFEETVTLFDVPEHRYQGLRYGNELADLVLAIRRRPTALIALNDEIAAGAMWRLQRAGLRFPEEISIFGFDNLPIAEQTQPGLCTVDHRVEATAGAATETLFKLIEGGPDAKLPVIKIEPSLVIRESVAPRG